MDDVAARLRAVAPTVFAGEPVRFALASLLERIAATPCPARRCGCRPPVLLVGCG